MGCGCSLGLSKGKIKMEKTKLSTLDDVFGQVQNFVDEVYEIMDPLQERRAKLLEETELSKVVCGNTHHAIIGTIFSLIVAVKNVRIDDLFKTSFEPPFIEIDASKATGNISKCVEILLRYIKTIVDAKDRIEPLIEKAKEFSETAQDLPDKAKEEINNIGLGPIEAIMAVKNTAFNCKQMGNLPKYLNELKDLVKCCLEEIMSAIKEINDKKSKLLQIGNICESKKFSILKDCYSECGFKIEVTPEAKKKWEKESKCTGGK